MLAVLGQIIGAAVGQTLQFPSRRELVLHVHRAFRVVGEGFLGMFIPAQFCLAQAQGQVPGPDILLPAGKAGFFLFLTAEELNFHLFKLAAPEDEVPGIYLVAETLADLGDAEGDLDPRGRADILEIHEDGLAGLGAQVGFHRRVLAHTHLGAQHAVERIPGNDRSPGGPAGSASCRICSQRGYRGTLPRDRWPPTRRDA